MTLHDCVLCHNISMIQAYYQALQISACLGSVPEIQSFKESLTDCFQCSYLADYPCHLCGGSRQSIVMTGAGQALSRSTQSRQATGASIQKQHCIEHTPTGQQLVLQRAGLGSSQWISRRWQSLIRKWMPVSFSLRVWISDTRPQRCTAFQVSFGP